MSKPLCCVIICSTHGPSIVHLMFAFLSSLFTLWFIYLVSTWVNEPTGVEWISLFHFATDYAIALFDKFCPEIVFCCYNCLDLPWEKFFQVWVTFFPSSWEQEYCVEKRLCKFEAVGREFVTFSRHYSCLRELGKQVTNTWKKLWAWYKSRQL